MTTNLKYRRKPLLVCLSIVILCACIKDRSFDAPENSCNSNFVANSTYAEVKNIYSDETIEIQEDLIIEGYVVSSDQAGNFFSVLHFQNKPSNPDEGFQIEIDVRDSHLFYPVGSKIFIKLKGLYLGKSKDVFKLGGVFTSFGNVSVGRLPATVADQHVFVSCESQSTVQATVMAASNIQKSHTNTLVSIQNVQIVDDDFGLPFAEEREETERILTDCDGNEIILLNSGFSDFYNEILPPGNGSLTGILLREKDDFQLAIRNLEDLNFNEDRCDNLINEVTSSNIIFSELADPENNSGARFVELYNSSTNDIPLNGWSLNRYTNDNVEISSSTDLSEYKILAESTFVIAANAEEFAVVFGFMPDLEAGKNSPADSNGDDNFQLVDPFGKVIDAFGIVGEDGSGTNHEFEDGRAVRNNDVIEGNLTYTFSEWSIFNDSGDASTIDQPQIAPDDFTPGVR